MKTIETYLPIFPGFYETMFEPYEDNEIDHFNDLRIENKLTPVTYDQFKFDYEEYENSIGKQCCVFIENQLSSYISEIKFQSICSPREYNFANDSINCEVLLSDENILSIKNFIESHSKEFETYIKDNYSSYDGFFSHYSNNPNEWINELDKALEHKHQLGSILNFICLCLDVNESDMFEACSDIYFQPENSEDLEYNEFCPVCKEFVSVNSFAGNCCTTCRDEKISNFELFLCSKCKDEITNVQEKRHLTYQLLHGLTLYSEILCNKCQ